MADEGALDRLANESDPRILGSLRRNDHARSWRQTCDELFSVGFQPVEPAGVLIKKGEENDGANCETGEIPFSWLQVSKKTEAENARYRCESGPEEPDPSVVQRRPQVFGEKHGRAKCQQVQFERQFERLPGGAVVPPSVKIHGHANNPKRECRARENEITIPVKGQLIRAVVEIERTAVPIRRERRPMRRIPAGQN